MKFLCLLALCTTAFAALKKIDVNQDIFNKNGAGHSSALGEGNQLKLVSEMKLPNGKVKQRYEQYFNGVPVSSTAVVTTKTDKGSEEAQGIMYEIDDSQGIMSLTTISREDALEIAKTKFMTDNNLKELDVPKTEMNAEMTLTVNPEHGEVYMVNFFVDIGKPHRPFYLIDASSGEIKDQWEGIDTENAGGPGGNLRTKKYMYGKNTTLGPLDVKRVGNNCYLENTDVKTVNLNHGTYLYLNPAHSFTCPDNLFKEVNGAYSPLNDAHYFGGLLYRMYNDWAGIPPLKFQLVLRVHYKSWFQNAFWNGRVMTFGDGASRFYPLVDINVVTHEAAHGFTGQNSGLIYRDQSGGMNEAYSDIAGESAEAYARKKVDWMVGADIFKQPGAAMRYFDNPEKNGRSIGHASKYYDGLDVHHSSGVYNRAYYLIVNSGKYSFKQAFILFTTANKLYWIATSTFDQGACGVESAAKDLGYDVAVVTSSFATVGVKCKPAPAPVHGGWSSWKNASICSKSCGGGLQKLIRTCTNPAPKNGGRRCSGSSAATVQCNKQDCPPPTTPPPPPCTNRQGDRYCNYHKKNGICQRRPDHVNYFCVKACTGCSTGSTVAPAPTQTQPPPTKMDCKFDSRSTCAWSALKNKEGNAWKLLSGATSSSRTGPSSDLSGTGFYIYMETSSPYTRGSSVALVSPTFRNRTQCLNFAYHMYGRTMGELRVSIVQGSTRRSIFSRKGNSGHRWFKESISITEDKEYKIEFVGIRGNGYQSDVALDEITFTPTCPPPTAPPPTAAPRRPAAPPAPGKREIK